MSRDPFSSSYLTLLCYFRARIIDERVADEIRATLESGVLTNTQNELFHRMSRISQRTAATLRKAHEDDDSKASKKPRQRRKDSELTSSSGRVKSRPASAPKAKPSPLNGMLPYVP